MRYEITKPKKKIGVECAVERTYGRGPLSAALSVCVCLWVVVWCGIPRRFKFYEKRNEKTR